ncbi:circumsporozoite protein-like [Eptesicus fuscus]|uniref:circumsporozoite protein-like n=1 Tax=Eptesicus fuscus TaxID=29078 RepID=UPI002403D92A|nr:circumsporozoite protein-like [Eptesicus fuscus]
MTPALRCACALALLYLAGLQLPERALGEELQPQRPRGPRAAYWLSTFGQVGKYLEKLFSSSVKSKDAKKSKDVKNPKKTDNSTKAPPLNARRPPPANATNLPPPNPAKPLNPTNPPPRNATQPCPPTSSYGPR